ncbi:HIT family protein [Vallitalea okinawensis]|uniref:HIT family protein n=1 Tax=Vallitalea okinawensis TaxID=2078660 RepID=UPI000CFE32B4|nr:HIT family protein [Vallitalea okinawensis]
MSDCILCKIAKGEIPSKTIYEDNQFKVFLDIFPGSKGHTLIIPKQHVANIFELDEETAGELFKIATKVAKGMKKVLGFEGMNIVQNNGEIAGQTIFHFHLHLIPRYKDDQVSIKWEPKEADQAVLQELRDALVEGLK